jgi:uncharacterized membrane protein
MGKCFEPRIEQGFRRVGAILVAIGSFVPVLAIVGIILVLIGMKGLSDAYGEKAIFQNALYGFIFEVVASAAFFFIFVGTLLRDLTVFRPIEFLAGFGLALVLAFIFFVLATYFYKKSFDTLSSKSNERLFGTAGLLFAHRCRPHDNLSRRIHNAGGMDPRRCCVLLVEAAGR